MAGDQPWEHLDSAEAGGPEQQRQLESPEPLSESAGLEDPSFDDGNSISSESDGGKVTSSRKNPQKDVKPDRKRSILLEKIRREIESGIKEHEITAAKYKTDINSCKIDNEGTNATILHWIVKRVELHDKFSEPEVKAGLKLASLALEVDPQLLLGQDKVNNETALHLAVKNQHRYDLVRCLCSEVPSDIVQKAIAVQNIYGETCIHMAIVEDDLDIAEELIAVADPSTFALKRKDDFNGKAFPAGNGGNTPLHDAVDYELCVCQSGASCPHEPICEDFSEAERRSKEQMNQVLRIIRSLVTKNNKALTIKNAADESPYLYHLATRKKHEEPLTTSASEKGIVSVPTRRQTIDLTSGVSGSETPKNGETDSMSGSMLQPNPGETLRTAHVVNGVSRGGNLTKSTITRPTGPENPQKSADITLQKKDNACEIPESTFIADRVLEYLEESSFALGSFEKTCACFFGEKPDKQGKTSIFRPVNPIVPDAESYYEKVLDCTQTMSQVDLIIAPLSTEDGMPKNPSADEAEMKGQQTLDQWTDDMRTLQKVFDMLRGKGVQRILKLMVRDNLRRPCSDEVIQSCLDGFDVRYLDWNKPDLCADVVLAKAPKLVELWLYSSGRNAVLRGWAGNNGLCNLNQLSMLHLDPRQGLEEYDWHKKNVEVFTQELTSNIDMTRGKLFLQSEKRSFEEAKIHAEEERNLVAKAIEKYRKDKKKAEEQLQKLTENNLLWKEKYTEEKRKAEEQLRKLGRDSGQTYGKYSEDKSKAEKLLQKLEENNEALKDKLSGKIQRTESRVESAARRIMDLDAEIEKVEKRMKLVENQMKHFEEWKKETEEAGKERFALSINKQAREKVEKAAGKVGGRGNRIEDVLTLEWPKIFSSPSGYVTSKFEAKTDIKPPPEQEDDTQPKLKPAETEEKEGQNKRHLWMESVEIFVNKYVKIAKTSKSGREVKVALIDDGVDANIEELKGHISKKGWPQEGPTSTNPPFYHSATRHGTEMAKLILSVCPHVQLCVAKLGAWTDKEQRIDALGGRSTAKDAADAIEWAIMQDVQIISMSWSLIRTRENEGEIRLLDKQIGRAADEGIIMFCAAADQGLYGEHTDLFPKKADTYHIKAIGSAQASGHTSTFVDDEQVDYTFPGEEIPGLANKGSSAATALATGFAALILWCFEAQNGVQGIKRMGHPGAISQLFKQLKASKTKWVDVTKVLSQDGTTATPGSIVTFCERKVDWKNTGPTVTTIQGS